MPFQSEKQRKYLHANHPEIAKRWERDYATGGISNLFKNRTGFHRGSLRHQKEHDYKSYEDEGNFMKYLLLSGDRASAYGWSPEGGTGPYPWPKIDPDKRMDYRQSRDDFETFMKERFMYGEKKSPLMKSELDKAINAWLKKQYKKLVGRDEGTEGLATGGISNLFKLKEGGNIRLQPHTASDLLVQKTSSGERPKYQPPGHTDAPSRSSDSGGHSQHATANVTSRPASTPSYKSVHDTGAVTQTPGRTTTTPDKGDGVYQDRIIELADRKRKSDLKDIVAQGEKTETWEKAQKWTKPSTSSKIIGGLITLATMGVLGPGAAKAAKYYGYYNKAKKVQTALKKGEVELFGKKLNLNKVTNKLKSSDQKLMASLPKGHPERIALEAQMKVKTPPKQDGEGGTETSIKIEDIETVNDANAEQVQLKKYRDMELAAYRAMIQQQEDRSKQMAYWKQLMAPYMAARGGRIHGYNTGGLSNLFRLKNV